MIKNLSQLTWWSQWWWWCRWGRPWCRRCRAACTLFCLGDSRRLRSGFIESQKVPHTTYQSRTETTKFEDNIVNAVSCFRGRGSSGKDGGEVGGLNQRRRLGSKSGHRGLGREKPRRASIYCIRVEMSRSCDFRRKPQMVKQRWAFMTAGTG